MRVLLDCRMAAWSGVGRVTVGLARALAARTDIEIAQVVAEGAEPPVSSGAAQVLRARFHPFDPRGGLELARLVRIASPDLTHCLHFPTPIPAPHPLAVMLHDLTPLVIPEVMPSAARRASWRWWNRRAVRVADLILVNSEHTAADIRRAFPRAASRVRVTLLAAEDFSDGPVGDLPAALAGCMPYLLSMGNVKPHKDLPTLLHAFDAFREAHPGFTLLLVGEEVPGFAESVLGDVPAARAVRFTGPVTDAELRALYRRAAVFAFPSLYEGFGLPPLEAMALGTPVVCASAASLPEVVGDAALTFPAGDAPALAALLARAVDDPAERERLVGAGKARAAAFAWERTADLTVAAYREVLPR